MTNKGRKKTDILIYTFIYLFLFLLVIICLLPFLSIMINATRESLDIQKNSLSLVPGNFLVYNWNKLSEYANLLKGFTNSLFVSVTTTFLASYICSLTAYGFRMYDFKGNKIIFNFLILLMMVPVQLGFIGYYNFMNNLGLIDNYASLILPGIASIGTLFFLKQYAEIAVNKDIVEAARIDGASEFYTFNMIGVPLMMPAIATMSIMGFIGSWNNYMSARILINSADKYTLPLMIANLKSSEVWYKHQGALYVGLAFSVIPIIIVFLSFSKYIISSIGEGAVKG